MDFEGMDDVMCAMVELDDEEPDEELEEDDDEEEDLTELIISTDVPTSLSSPKKHKKSKKHKHHKKKKQPPEADLSATPPIKLKFKIGGQMVGTKSINVNSEGVEELDDPLLFADPGSSFFSQAWSIKKEDATPQDDIFRTKPAKTSTSDDEQQWLDALEAGTLDDSGAVKKDKDPSLLTTRQKALLHGKKDSTLLELPTGYRTPELTEEQIQRRQQRAQKRREQAQEKREKDKKQTVERLLKKQDTKMKGFKSRGNRRGRTPSFRYINRVGHITLSTPLGYSFPYPGKTSIQSPAIKLCGVSGCQNLKKYNCSKTGIPLCSLQCYQQNMAQNIT